MGWIDLVATVAVAVVLGVGFVGGLVTAVALDLRDQWRAQRPIEGRLLGPDGEPVTEG